MREIMNGWLFLYIYVSGGALVALRVARHTRFWLDKSPIHFFIRPN